MNVLVVEDHADSRAAMVQVLLDAHHEVVAVEDAVAARTVLDTMLRHGQGPDVVVSDVVLPGASGLLFVSALRAAGSRARVVLVTAWPTGQLKMQARALDASVLIKPLDLSRFVGVVEGDKAAISTSDFWSMTLRRVLVVHDAMVDITAIRAALEKEVVVRSTPDPRAALTIIENGVACIVCVAGGTVHAAHCHALRYNTTTRPPLVFVADDPEDKELLESAGDIVVPPGDGARLLAAVHSVMGDATAAVS